MTAFVVRNWAVGFMSERATGTAFGSMCCVGDDLELFPDGFPV
jgi:hypothetical protein